MKEPWGGDTEQHREDQKPQCSKRPSQLCSICNTKTALMGNTTERGEKNKGALSADEYNFCAGEALKII